MAKTAPMQRMFLCDHMALNPNEQIAAKRLLMTVDAWNGWLLFIQVYSFFGCQSNAAPEWQAGSLGWRSRGLMVACPLEGLVGLSRCAADSNPL